MQIRRSLSFFLIFGAALVVEPAARLEEQGFALAAQATQSQESFERYRKAIKDAYGIDIKDFKGNLAGGRADGKPLTKYDLNQLLMGIKIELEHTSDKMLALEITTDHLEEIPDYYTRLKKMEDEAEKDQERNAGKR